LSQVFFVVYVMLVCFHHVRTVGVRYMHIYALKTQGCVCDFMSNIDTSSTS
jgi:hypothetical protein